MTDRGKNWGRRECCRKGVNHRPSQLGAARWPECAAKHRGAKTGQRPRHSRTRGPGWPRTSRGCGPAGFPQRHVAVMAAGTGVALAIPDRSRHRTIQRLSLLESFGVPQQVRPPRRRTQG